MSNEKAEAKFFVNSSEDLFNQSSISLIVNHLISEISDLLYFMVPFQLHLYGVSESTAQRISRWVEDTLIKDKQFALPGKKALLKSDMVIEVALVDRLDDLNAEVKSPARESDPSQGLHP